MTTGDETAKARYRDEQHRESEERTRRDVEIFERNKAAAQRVAAVLDQLSDDEIAQLQSEIVESCDKPFLRTHHSGWTIEQLRSGSGHTTARMIADRAVANDRLQIPGSKAQPRAHAAGRLFGSDSYGETP